MRRSIRAPPTAARMGLAVSLAFLQHRAVSMDARRLRGHLFLRAGAVALIIAATDPCKDEVPGCLDGKAARAAKK
jgi:hypothetical protein